jgi:hypothetical protein
MRTVFIFIDAKVLSLKLPGSPVVLNVNFVFPQFSRITPLVCYDSGIIRQRNALDISCVLGAYRKGSACVFNGNNTTYITGSYISSYHIIIIIIIIIAIVIHPLPISQDSTMLLRRRT